MSAAHRLAPLRVELDIPRPEIAASFEEAFGAPVRFGAPVAAICFAASHLDAAPPRPRPARLTIEDVFFPDLLDT